MPKSRGPGGKNRRRAKAAAQSSGREMVFKDDDSLYAYVVTANGDMRYTLLCGDGVTRTGILRGSMRKRRWVSKGDMVLATRRDYQDDKVDVVHKYDYADVMYLNQLRELEPVLTRAYNSGGTEFPDSVADAGEDTVVFADDEDDMLVDRI